MIAPLMISLRRSPEKPRRVMTPKASWPCRVQPTRECYVVIVFDLPVRRHVFPSSPGSLAMLAAMRLASSRVS